MYASMFSHEEYEYTTRWPSRFTCILSIPLVWGSRGMDAAHLGKGGEHVQAHDLLHVLGRVPAQLPQRPGGGCQHGLVRLLPEHHHQPRHQAVHGLQKRIRRDIPLV